MAYTTTIVSQKQIMYFMSQVSGMDAKYYPIDEKNGEKWHDIRVDNFWKMYKQFKEITVEKLERIWLANGIKTIGDVYNFIESKKCYGLELRYYFPEGRLTKRNGEWRFYYNI